MVMTFNELIADVLVRNLEGLKFTLADFSDAEMLVRPCPGANHALWQLGHLTLAEGGLLNMIKPDSAPELPAGIAEKFTNQTTSIDDPKAFPSKAELLALLARARGATVQVAKTITEEHLSRPSSEPMRGMFPTLGHVLMLIPQHVSMHMGQMQAIRRKLGKPVLF